MIKTVKDFVDNEVDPASHIIEETDNIPEDIMEKCKNLGLFGLSIPAEYGGVGIGMLGKCLIYEQLGRTSNGFTTRKTPHSPVVN